MHLILQISFQVWWLLEVIKWVCLSILEELPEKILDLAYASHAWFASTGGLVVGFAENALLPDGTVDPGSSGSVGWDEGYLDIISTGAVGQESNQFRVVG